MGKLHRRTVLDLSGLSFADPRSVVSAAVSQSGAVTENEKIPFKNACITTAATVG